LISISFHIIVSFYYSILLKKILKVN
jgi:hypothetical protein